MIPTVQSLLLAPNTEISDALETRLKSLSITHSETDKTILQLQAREIKRENTFLENRSTLESIFAAIDAGENLDQLKNSITPILESAPSSINSVEVFRFILKHGMLSETINM
ncbi:hypothetical protein NEIG_00673 [Nematocida sp. ERTm5]|nr:hypothetical protein NEIG_00673 [Nematocida sp. ERTm5]